MLFCQKYFQDTGKGPMSGQHCSLTARLLDWDELGHKFEMIHKASVCSVCPSDTFIFSSPPLHPCVSYMSFNSAESKVIAHDKKRGRRISKLR